MRSPQASRPKSCPLCGARGPPDCS